MLLSTPPRPPPIANYLNMTSLIAARGGIYKSTVKLRGLCNQRRDDYLLTSRACNERARSGGDMLLGGGGVGAGGISQRPS